MYLTTITLTDIGRRTLRRPPYSIDLSDSIGRVLPIDIGKRVYLTDETIQVESLSQLRRRIPK